MSTLKISVTLSIRSDCVPAAVEAERIIEEAIAKARRLDGIGYTIGVSIDRDYLRDEPAGATSR